MKTDRYTKLLLTVVAICLINLSFSGANLFPKAYAGNDAGLKYGLVPINEDGSITVKLSKHDEIDVNITNISTSDELSVDLAEISTSDKLSVNLTEISTSDEMDINIAEVGGHFVHISSGIPVKIKD